MDDLLHLARRMMLHAHAPYSKFHVGAALRSADGSIHGGCNVENAAYPQGWCAEPSAIAAMVGAGQKRILECLVIGPGPELITPCGGCRQKLREFAGGGAVPVWSADLRRVLARHTLAELLPASFGPDQLGPR